MTVVRNEMESGENSPSRILMQKMQAAAFQWHSYGKNTIGARPTWKTSTSASCAPSIISTTSPTTPC